MCFLLKAASNYFGEEAESASLLFSSVLLHGLSASPWWQSLPGLELAWGVDGRVGRGCGSLATL